MMKDIRAFIGHSFAEEDAAPIRQFLDYFRDISNSHSYFSWEDAESAEPIIITDKVIRLFENKNLFIGICTKKERVINDKNLKKGLWGFSWAKENCYEWKTSDWIIQEIGFARGRDIDIILLIECGVRPPEGIQGGLEYIEFEREKLEKSFPKLLQMIAALSPKNISNSAITKEIQPATNDTSCNLESGKEDADWSPKPEWTQEDFEAAFCVMLLLKDNTRAQNISDTYLARDDATQVDKKTQWNIYCEYIRIALDQGGNFLDMETLVTLLPNSKNLHYLAKIYNKYEDYNRAAITYEKAANVAENNIDKVELLGQAAVAYSSVNKENHNSEMLRILNQMRTLIAISGADEIELLKTLKKIAEVAKNGITLLAVMERMLDIDPSDKETRVYLAYKHYEAENNDLALYHYLKVPADEREAGVWNNIGVAFDHLGMPIKSVQAYRHAEEAGETLAMNNLAQKFIKEGFLAEAEALCTTALKDEEHCHENIYSTKTQLINQNDEENKKEEEALKKTQLMRDFYIQFGKALSKTAPISLSQEWKGPDDCTLEINIQENLFKAAGSYMPPRSIFVSTLIGGGSIPIKHYITYQGAIQGHTISGYVTHEQEEDRKKIPSILGMHENKIDTLIIISDDLKELRVMEKVAGGAPKIYNLNCSSI